LKSTTGPGAAGRGDPAVQGYRMARKEMSAEDATALHVKDFIECVRSRGKPVADVETGHHSSNVAHLGNIAYRTGRKIQWDARNEEIAGDTEASALLGRRARKPWDLLPPGGSL
jgi:hypothetical protein